MGSMQSETFEKFFLAWVYDDANTADFQKHFYNTFVTPWHRPAHAQDYRELRAELILLAERFGFESVDDAFQALDLRWV